MTAADTRTSAEPAPAARSNGGAAGWAFAGGVLWSLGALCSRSADRIDAWQYLTWRSIGVLVTVEALARARRQRSAVMRAFRSGRIMFVGCLCLGTASFSYVYAIKNTSAVNAALLAATTPLMAAVVSRFTLGEHLDRVTIAAMTVATGGLALMVVGDGGAGQPRTLSGDLAALVSAIAFGGYAACVRSSRETDWTPIMPGYAAMAIVGCGAVTALQGRSLVPPIDQSGYALFHGAVLIVIGTTLYNHASKRATAGAAALFAQAENVFVPVWIFVAFGDRPGVGALAGGVVVLLAVSAKAVYDARRT